MARHLSKSVEGAKRNRLGELLSIGYGFPVSLQSRMDRLRCLAAITLLHLEFPPLPSLQRAERLAKAAGLRKYEGQPRQTESANPGWLGPGKQGNSRLPMHDNGGPSAEDKRKNPKAEEQEKHVTPLVPLPDAKKDVFKNNDDWERFNDLVAERPGSTGTEQIIYPSIFAWEGGFKTGGNGAYAGITKSFLSLAQNENNAASAEKAVPGILDVETPSDLSDEQVVRLYRWYFDSELKNVGGHTALDDIESPYAAAELADVLFTEGSPAAVPKIVDAINEVLDSRGEKRIASSRTMNQEIYDAYCRLAQDSRSCGQLMDALAAKRALQFQNGRAKFLVHRGLAGRGADNGTF